MARVSPIQNSFNVGELAPTLEGRTDFEKYRSGCYLMENFIPLVQGPAERRPGTHFVAAVKNSLVRTWLVPFHFNQSQSYVLEIGHLCTRFYYQRGQLLQPASLTPYEIVAPWVGNDLTNDDGTFRPSYVQSNDVIVWANYGYFPQLLERRGHTDWAFRQFGLDGTAGSFKASQWAFQWPFGAYNVDDGKRIYASAATGSINLVASSGHVFEDWMVGQLLMMEQDDGSTVPAWEAGKSIAAVNTERRVENRVYRSANAATTGTVRPTHTEGFRTDGDAAVLWQFVHAGFGIIQIDAVTDAAHASGTVIMELPSDVVGSSNNTARWRLSAWQTNDGFPTVVFFFRERLGFARGTTLWFSAPGDFFNFAELDANGEVTDDQAVTLTLASDTADPIRWARETPQGLLVGTDGGEWLIEEADSSLPFSATNAHARRQSAYGTRPIRPVAAQSAILYVQRGGRKVREAMWTIETESIRSRDVTALSEHITQTGITSMAFQQEPRSTLWATRKDGLLIAFTYNAEQDVYGWHRHPVGGDGDADCVCSIPSPDGDQDDLWMIVRRVINGNVGRYVEWLDPGYKEGDAIKDAWYVDCGAAYAGVPVTSVSGLDYLEGREVDVLADGSPQARKTVLSGAITLDSAASKVIVGLPCTAMLATMRRDEGAADGTAQGKLKRATEVMVRLLRTVGGKIGAGLDALESIVYRDSSVGMGSAIEPFTGDKRLPWPGNIETDMRLWVVQDQPLPMTVVAIAPQLITQDKG
jgi:hypothetical protein